MRKILLGFMLGVLITGGLYFFIHPDPVLRAGLGRLLDKDTIHLTDGTIVKVWVIKKTDRGILVELENRYFVIPHSRIKRVRENFLQKYVREFF